MNLRQVIRGPITAVNTDQTVSIMQSSGYTTAADGTQIPQYATLPGISCQIQGLSADDLKHLDGLNIQGVLRSFWFNGSLEGTDRLLVKGGDLIVLADGRTWLVAKVFETWEAAGWCHVAGLLQE